MAKFLAASTGKTEDDILRDFARPRYFTPAEAVAYGIIDQVLEPSDGRGDVKKDFEAMGAGATTTWRDDEQPLPTNVMWEGTSDYWRNDDFLAVSEEGGVRDWGREYGEEGDAVGRDGEEREKAEAGGGEGGEGAAVAAGEQ